MLMIYSLLLFALCSPSELFDEYYPEAEKYLKNMTMEERIGQMFFPRFNKSSSAEDIKTKKPGGFILYAYDLIYDEEYIKNYIKEIQKLAFEYNGIPLGLAVDEEGGTVCRVSLYHRKEGKFPSPQDIYKKSGIKGILNIDQEKRDLLRKFYLNVNLAPVADVSYNKNDYIYQRTLGKSPNETAYYIGKDVEGYVNDNFTCCAKHFPGYGNNINTHGDVARDNRSYETFQKEDFLPFEAAIEQKIPMILVSHDIVLCKDSQFPASISPIWHNILRNELNYTGLILTDDMSMEAIKKFTNKESEAVLAVLAGNDIILTSDYYMHFNDVVEAYHAGKIDDNIINTACRRILAWKLKYGIIHNDSPTPSSPILPYIEMIRKLKNITTYHSMINTFLAIGTLLFEKGYETSFVAGILGNIYHENSIGKFESSDYTSNPNDEPEYLKYMDDLYGYRTKYSNKIITEVSLKELGILLIKLKRYNWKRGKFGLGWIKWIGEKTFDLYKEYLNECNNQGRISLYQASKAEGKMVINDLNGEYKYVYDQWKKDNNNTFSSNAAYDAGKVICSKYVMYVDSSRVCITRGKTAQDIYNIMTK